MNIRLIAFVFATGAAAGYVAHAYRVATNLDLFATRIHKVIAKREQLLLEEHGAPSAETASRAEG